MKLNNICAMFGLVQLKPHGQRLAGIQLLDGTIQISSIGSGPNASFPSWTYTVDLARKAAFSRNYLLLRLVVRVQTVGTVFVPLSAKSTVVNRSYGRYAMPLKVEIIRHNYKRLYVTQ